MECKCKGSLISFIFSVYCHMIIYKDLLLSYSHRQNESETFHTIEGDLFEALHKAGVITEQHARDTKVVG